MMTCCALGDRDDQDAILGHVASRGDRFPRAANKTLAGRPVNGYVRGFFAIDHEQFSVAEERSGDSDWTMRPVDPGRKRIDAT
jgi:hypothetical protein